MCPVQIPLPKLMRHWREREFERHLTPATVRSGLGLWAFFAKRPRSIASPPAMAIARAGLGGTPQGAFQLAAASPAAGRSIRDLPAPQGETFQARWRREHKGRAA